MVMALEVKVTCRERRRQSRGGNALATRPTHLELSLKVRIFLNIHRWMFKNIIDGDSDLLVLSTCKVLPGSVSKWVKEYCEKCFQVQFETLVHSTPLDTCSGRQKHCEVSSSSSSYRGYWGYHERCWETKGFPIFIFRLNPICDLYFLLCFLSWTSIYNISTNFGTLSLLRCLADYYHSICLFYWALRCWIERYRYISTSILETSVGWSCVSAPPGAWQILQGDCQ